MRTRFHLPGAFRHPVALLGVSIATVMGVLFVTLFLIDAFGFIHNPYFGLLLFIANVKWGTYPNHIGHLDTPACFRCHDDEHKSKDGKVIRQDCALCHNEVE